MATKSIGDRVSLGRASAKAVILAGRYVLLLQKPNGKWDLPGGRVDEGETIVEALAREVYEESGLDVVVDRYLTTVNRTGASARKGPLFSFLCKTSHNLKKKPLLLSEEHVDAALVHIRCVDELPMSAACSEAVCAAQRALAIA